jgi:GNAT superfamily N-acetyltransferase
MSLDARLFDNHLAFLAAHRGDVSRSAGFVRIDSSSPEFTAAIAEDATSLDALPARYPSVRLLPWSRLTEADLLERGLDRCAAFTYMTLGGPLAPAAPPGDLSIEVVADKARLDVFSDVQTRGFVEPDESYEAWVAWLGEKNLENLGRAGQRYYLASRAGQPVGVTLTVATPGVVGIYAVTTLPEQRRAGVSRALLARAVADARREGAEVISLQVYTGSYAEGFYGRLGFSTAFVSPVFARG